MKIVIVGDGKIGSTLAEQLSREGHEITIIDRSGEPLQQTSEDLDILCVEGNGATYATQMEAGVDSADLLIAVTMSDELNLLCCLVAKKIGARHTIARVRNPEYSGELSLISDDLGLSLSVNPELLCATEIARTLRIPSAIKTDTFANGHVELLKVQIPPDSILAGKTLMELPGPGQGQNSDLRGRARRAGRSTFRRARSGWRRATASRSLHRSATRRRFSTRSSSPRLARADGHDRRRRAHRVLSGQAADRPRHGRQDHRRSNYERCLQLSTLLPKAEILHGDGTNEGFLRECGVAQTDAFAALTGIDEENVLMGLYVRKTFPKVKVITKINRYSFQSIIETMDLGSVFNPRFSTSNVICRYARSMQNSLGSNVETLYKLVGGKAEALEFRVAEGSAVCGIPLQTLRLRKNLLIGCINRAGKILIPSGQDTIEPGDTVVVVTSVTGLNELDDILDKRRG